MSMKSMESIMNNKYVSTTLTVIIILYISLLGPTLPSTVRNLFNNSLFRMLVLFLVLLRFEKDPGLSIVITVSFVLTMDYVNAMDAKETFASVNNLKGCPEGTVWEPLKEIVFLVAVPLDGYQTHKVFVF